MSSKRLLALFSVLVALLTVLGAVSFVATRAGMR